MNRPVILLRVTALLAMLCSIGASAQVAVPTLTGRVTDLTGTLSGAAVSRIEAKLAELEAKKGSQVAVLMVPTTQPEDIEQFGIRVAEQWKLGRKGVDDGAILIVAKNDRRARIEVGYGLEGALPDATASRIVDDTMVPLFKQTNYDAGVEAGVDRIIAVVQGEALPEPDHRWERGGTLANSLPVFLFAVAIASLVLRAVFGRLIGAAATGGLAAVLVFVLSHLLMLGVGAGVLAFLFALFLGASGGWTSGGWGGGLGGGFRGGGFGGFGGGGGGGFSGGGGGFGGGGASGSW